MHALRTGPAGARPSVVTLSSSPRILDAARVSLDLLDCERIDADDLDAALALLHEHAVDVLLVCDGPAGELANRARAAHSRLRCATQLVVATPTDSEPAHDVLDYPWDEAWFERTIRAATHTARLVAENASLRQRLAARTRGLVPSRNAHVLELHEECTRAAESSRDVVFVAEPGTLLESWARLVHDSGPRSDAPFVRLDGRTLTTETFEAECQPGGRIDRARGGTIFVDHLDAASETIQNRIRHRTPALRIAGSDEWSEQFVVGWYGEPEADVVTAAQRFAVPALRDRTEDVPDLVAAFLDDVADRHGQPPKSLDPAAVERLVGHDWPGNDAELLGVVENAFTTATDTVICDDVVRGWIGSGTDGLDDLGVLPLRTMERRLIEATFERCDGNRERTAKSLGIGIRTLSGKLREYGYPPRGGPRSNRRPMRDAA